MEGGPLSVDAPVTRVYRWNGGRLSARRNERGDGTVGSKAHQSCRRGDLHPSSTLATVPRCLEIKRQVSSQWMVFHRSRTGDKGEGGRGDVEVGFEWAFSSALYHVADGKPPARREIGRSEETFHVNAQIRTRAPCTRASTYVLTY